MNRIADPGYVFVCGACGKTSQDQYGYLNHSYGWDESCILNAVVCKICKAKLTPLHVHDINFVWEPADPNDRYACSKPYDEVLKKVIE